MEDFKTALIKVTTFVGLSPVPTAHVPVVWRASCLIMLVIPQSNQPYLLSVYLPPVFPPLLTVTVYVV